MWALALVAAPLAVRRRKMKAILVCAALVAAQAAPAMAGSLGCWATQSIKTNSTPAGTWKNTASSTVDYIETSDAGVAKLMASLPNYATQAFAVCMDGNSVRVNNKKVWQLATVVICQLTRVANGGCS
ncbi:MAG: hypothetical protein R3F55_06545 [Alphaproteobacteria bacterium]